MTTTLIWTNPELAQSQTNCTYDIPTITLWAAFIEQTIQNELDANGLPVNPPLPGNPGYIVGSGSGLFSLGKLFGGLFRLAGGILLQTVNFGM